MSGAGAPRRVLVTGGRGALGAAVLAALVGHRRHATCRPGPPPPAGEVVWLPCDLADPAAVQATLAAPPFDVVVHCAGGFRCGPLTATGDADFDTLVDANLRASFYLLRAVLPGMRARNFGRVVLVGAAGALRPAAGQAAYAATKAATHALVQAVAAELTDVDVAVNAVLPGVLDTAANRAAMPDADVGRWVTPQALASVAVGLTEAGSAPIRGALLPVVGRA